MDEILKSVEARVIAGEFAGRVACINAKGEIVEPVVGQWFCDFDLDHDGKAQDGALVEYVGDGEFYEEGSDDRHRLYGVAYVLQQ